MDEADDIEERRRRVAEAARRALAEAAGRRNARAADATTGDSEKGGRDGPEPVRFGDWERAGRAIDF